MAAGGSARHYSGPSVEPHRPRRLALALFCACLAAYGYFIYRGGHHNPDSRLALTYAIVERRALDIDTDAPATRDRSYVGGHYYTDKAPGLSLLLVPLYAGLRLVLPDLTLPGGPAAPADRFVARYLLTFFGLGVPAALFAPFLFSWLGRVEPRPAPRLAVAAGYALGSPVYPFVVSAFGHVPAGMCLFLSFALLSGGGPAGRPWDCARRRRRALGAGCLLGLGTAFEYPAALAGLPVAVYGVWRATAPRRPAVAGWLLAGAALPLGILGGYHWAAFGLPWSVGYGHLDPTSPYAAGQSSALFGVGWPTPGTALALLAGLRRGLVVYAPWLALVLPGTLLLWRRQFHGPALAGGRETLPVAATAVAVFLVLLAVNSGYVFWDGGASWGPRHLIPARTLPDCTGPAGRCAGPRHPGR